MIEDPYTLFQARRVHAGVIKRVTDIDRIVPVRMCPYGVEINRGNPNSKDKICHEILKVK